MLQGARGERKEGEGERRGDTKKRAVKEERT